MALPADKTEAESGWLSYRSEAFGLDSIVGLAFEIIMLITAVPAPDEFDAEIETLKFPACEGFPEIFPVDEFTLSPAGRPLAEKLVGKPDAVIE